MKTPRSNTRSKRESKEAPACERAQSAIRALYSNPRRDAVPTAETERDPSDHVASLAHVASCTRCAVRVGDLLGNPAPPVVPRSPRGNTATVLRRLVRIVADCAPGAREILRHRLEDLLALRALRCVAAEDDRAEIAASLARERAAALAVEQCLIGLRLLRDSDSDPATAELRRFTRDFSDSGASYEALRHLDVLLPRPPRLPKPGDWHGRDLVILWASSLHEHR